MAQTTNDWPRRVSPAANTLATFVAYIGYALRLVVPKTWIFTGMVSPGGEGLDSVFVAIDSFRDKATYAASHGLTIFAPRTNVEARDALEFSRRMGYCSGKEYWQNVKAGVPVQIVAIGTVADIVSVLAGVGYK